METGISPYWILDCQRHGHEPKQLQSILWIKGVLEILRIRGSTPRMKAFDQDMLLLIVPDSSHTQYTPITLGIDMAIKLATKKELETLNKQ